MEKTIYKSPLNYTGAKDKLMPELLKHFPKDVDTFYDVFAGGLSVTVNCDYQKIVANDVIKPMMEFYEKFHEFKNIENFIVAVKNHAIPKDCQQEFLDTREGFNRNKDPFLFFSLVSSCTNNMMRFNKKFEFNQTFGKRTINDSTVQKLRDYYRLINKKDIRFTSLDYKELLMKESIGPKDFVYLDPPYMITQAGYNAYWSKVDEFMMYSMLEMLDANGVRFVMSNVREHNGVHNPHMDKIQKYHVYDIEYDYEKVAKKKGKGTQEIIVKNF